MRTITVYLETESERKKKSRKRHVFALIAASIIAVVVVADRKPPQAVVVPQAPQRPREFVKVVDRPVYVYTGPIGPAPAPAPPPVETPPRTTIPRRRPPPTPPKVTETKPPVETPVPAPEPAPAPPPLRSLVIEPPAIDFAKGRTQAVAIFNPNDRPVVITHIALVSRSSEPVRGYKLEGENECERRLEAGERCWFKAVASRFGRSRISDLRIHAKGDAVTN